MRVVGRSVAVAASVAVALAALLVHPATGLLLAGAATLHLLRRRLGRFTTPLAVALGLRALVVYAHAAGMPLPDDSRDAVGFHRLASAYAADAPAMPPIGSDLYPWLLSWPYRLLGADVMTGEALNVLLQVLAVGLVAASASRVWNDRAGVALAWGGAVFPGLVLYGVVLLREALLVALMALWLYASVRAQWEGRLRWLAPAALALAGLYVLHQAFTYIAPLMAAWSVVAPWFRRIPARPAVTAVLTAAPMYLIVILLFSQTAADTGGLPGPAGPGEDLWEGPFDGGHDDGADDGNGTDGSGGAGSGGGSGGGGPGAGNGTTQENGTNDPPDGPRVDPVEKAQRDRLVGRASYPEWTVLDDDASVAFVAVVRLVLLLLSPLPWWIERAADGIAFLDGLAYAGLCVLSLVALGRRRPANTMAPVVLLLVLGLSIYAMGTSNYGTAFRHRAKFALLLMLVAAPELHRIGDKAGAWALGAARGARSGRSDSGPTRPRILFLNNDAAGFARQRAPLVAAANRHYEVRVGLPAGRGDPNGFRMWRRSVSPLREWRSRRSVHRFIAREEPDLVHAFTIKPVIYGTMAARHQGIPVVNTITGTGHVFVGRGPATALLRAGVKRLYRRVLRGPGVVTVFQNRDDRDLFVRHGLVEPERTRLVPGSGVDLEAYRPSPLPEEPEVVLPGRMLETKGVEEFVVAARILRDRGAAVRMVLVGDPDPGNPASITAERLRAWDAEGAVSWRGHQENMTEVYRRARVVCLPSHGEGVPLALLEAAASGRPLVATDVPGCREVVLPGETGLLVPPRDPEALADAIETVLGDAEGAARMGAAARRLAEERFDRRIVHELYLHLYEELLGQPNSMNSTSTTVA